MPEPETDSTDLGRRTIRDFGEQWTAYTDNSGYYGSVELLDDVFGPLLEKLPLAGARIADIGAGTGRFVHILLEKGATHVTALEPSEAFAVLEKNTQGVSTRVTCLNVPGDQLPQGIELDLVFSYGVLHHIPDPGPVIRAAWGALRPGGTCAVWLYGREGNQAYLFAFRLLTSVTRRLPSGALEALTWLLYWPASAYMILCRYIRAPLAAYMREIFSRLSPDKRRLVIYDQLNPAYARYYTGSEARGLLEKAGFEGVRLYHRHGYSWSVVGTRPRDPA